MADCIDVDVAELRRAAGMIDGAVGRAGDARDAAAAGVGTAAGAYGAGPLAGALFDLSTAVSDATSRYATAIAAAADGLRTTATNYQTSDDQAICTE